MMWVEGSIHTKTMVAHIGAKELEKSSTPVISRLYNEDGPEPVQLLRQ